MSQGPQRWRGSSVWRDAAPPTRSPFQKARAVEVRYSRLLRSVAEQVGRLIEGFGDPLSDPHALVRITEALTRYGDLLGPWAQTVAARVVAELDRQDEAAWNRQARAMSRALRQEITGAPTGEAMRIALAQQVALIKSLPTEAAERVHRLTLEGITQGTRASEIAKEIARSGEVTKARATLIARTEVSRTATELTKARAVHVGSEGYIWRTVRDSDVRLSHRKMEGRFVAWDAPPTLDGLTGHAGCLPNCRCWTEVVVPERWPIQKAA